MHNVISYSFYRTYCYISNQNGICFWFWKDFVHCSLAGYTY